MRTVAGASIGGAAILSGGALRPALATTGREAYPTFSWDRVPYAAQTGKFRGDYTASEIEFIANHFAFIAVGPGTGLGDKPAAERIQEVGFYRAARALKAVNAACKVLLYWGGPGGQQNYAADKTFDPSWRIGNTNHYDVANPGLREWWARSAAEIVAHADVDGVFIDGLNPEGDHPHHTEMLTLLRQRLTALPKPALLLINGVPAPGRNGLPSMLDLCDGMMIEHFGILGHKPARELKEYMLDVLRFGKMGKIVLVKTWPSFNFMEPQAATMSYADKAAAARRDIPYALSLFLAVAQPYSYMQYGWGYENIGGAYVLDADGKTADPTWYPELLHPLGEPLGDPSIDGYVFAREFRHASVRVDLAAARGEVNWR